MRGQAKGALLVTLGALALFVGYGVMTYNRLVKLHEQIPAAWSQVENVLQRRNDLIPNLVNTVKGYAKQEKEIFTQIAEARISYGGRGTISAVQRPNWGQRIGDAVTPW